MNKGLNLINLSKVAKLNTVDSNIYLYFGSVVNNIINITRQFLTACARKKISHSGSGLHRL